MTEAQKIYGKAVSIRKQIKNLEKEYNKQIQEYRRVSVNRVLDFVRTETRQGREVDIDTLLCHCQNKLNGNIDGTELNLEYEKNIERKGL